MTSETLTTRVLSAVIIAPLFIGIVLYGSPQHFAILILFVSAICFLEYLDMAKKAGIKIFGVPGLVSVLFLPLVFLLGSVSIFIVFFVITIGFFLLALNDNRDGVKRLAFTLLGGFYIGILLSAPVPVRMMAGGEKLILLICVSVWGADIGAYFVGKAIGKHKLAPSISPGKSWEGFAGGLLSALIFAELFVLYILPNSNFALPIASGLIAGVFGPLGDLSESMIKRYFGVKDSGKTIPGHGGLLDRIDALLFAIPAFYIYLQLGNRLF